jgi:RNA polymerase subunit RPABC4/transcription elongation factor Spt4
MGAKVRMALVVIGMVNDFTERTVGHKRVRACKKCLAEAVLPEKASAPVCPSCGGKTKAPRAFLVKKEEVSSDMASVDGIRSYLIAQLIEIPTVE